MIIPRLKQVSDFWDDRLNIDGIDIKAEFVKVFNGYLRLKASSSLLSRLNQSSSTVASSSSSSSTSSSSSFTSTTITTNSSEATLISKFGVMAEGGKQASYSVLALVNNEGHKF
jgi:activator of HSP90 ATPase